MGNLLGFRGARVLEDMGFFFWDLGLWERDRETNQGRQKKGERMRERDMKKE